MGTGATGGGPGSPLALGGASVLPPRGRETLAPPWDGKKTVLGTGHKLNVRECGPIVPYHLAVGVNSLSTNTGKS